MNIPNRLELAKALNGVEPVVRALELLFQATNLNTAALGTGAEATVALQDATVLTLSPNDTFTNERVVQSGQGIQLIDTGTALIIRLLYNLIINGGFQLRINLPADVDLTVIQSGTIMLEEDPMADLGDYADDAAAAAAGVPVRGLYRTANAVMVRIA